MQTTSTLIVRFPNGESEFHSGSRVPSVGDRLTRRSTRWIVARVETKQDGRIAVTLMPAEVERLEDWPAPYAFVAVPH